MPDEELDDVVHARADGRASLVDLVEVDEGLVECERARVDELHDRRAEAVWVADVLEAFFGLDELEVGRGRDYRKLACRCGEGVSMYVTWTCMRIDIPRMDTAMGAGTSTSADGNAYDVLRSLSQ